MWPKASSTTYKVCWVESKFVHLLFLISLPLTTSRYSTRRYLDKRTWRQRVTRMHANWEPLLPVLTELYIGWKYANITLPPSSMTVGSSTPPPTDPTFEIEVVDIYTLDTSVTILCSSEDLPINALVKSGYLGNTPMRPTLAISLRTLELFWRIRSRKSSFSVESFTKVVCDLYSVLSPLV